MKLLLLLAGRFWSRLSEETDIRPKPMVEIGSKAYMLLNWNSVWSRDTIFEKTVKWYKSFYSKDKDILTKSDLESYIKDAKHNNIEWSN